MTTWIFEHREALTLVIQCLLIGVVVVVGGILLASVEEWWRGRR